ncbi:hypothetical protein BDB00DRAFT_260413 [Zychaea mexicana]|uniref:uncharacterized protein n=1 Tax=Zychaea mexicana TaxID=64656 RepID=UPI0022FED0FA|nr:uncharacterized protein BDB00DRAFT_260413 [Zychaea mexicana]KAI9495274.1 hypothetical protein BDB00DRAFT_260413 [Zychaea mexicana]
MDLLYRMPTSLHCSHKRSHSPSSSLQRQIFKKKKRAHDLTYPAFPEHLQQAIPIGHDNIAHNNIPMNIPKQQTHNSSSSTNEVILINDMDAFLAGDDVYDLEDTANYTLLHGDKSRHLVDVKFKDGSSIPMERRAGERRLRIPDFVLNGSNTTTASTNHIDEGSSNRALIRYQPPLRPNNTGASEGTRQQHQDEENERGDRMMELDSSSSYHYHHLPQPHNNSNDSVSSSSSREDEDNDTIIAMEID